MAANVFATIRPWICGHGRGPSSGHGRGPSSGTDRRDPTVVGANHVGELIRRYSPLGLRDTARRIDSPLFAPGLRETAIKKPSPMAVGEGCAGGVMAGESLP